MKNSEIARRYVRAVIELVPDIEKQENLLNELRAIEHIFCEKEIAAFIASPVNQSSEKEVALKSALGGQGLSEEALNLILLLAHKGRLGLYSYVVQAYQSEMDRLHGCVRGVVKSAATLDEGQRKSVERNVGMFLKKQVILNYEMDPSLMGGLIAQVGSHTFDDSLKSHLRRLKENLNRSTH